MDENSSAVKKLRWGWDSSSLRLGVQGTTLKNPRSLGFCLVPFESHHQIISNRTSQKVWLEICGGGGIRTHDALSSIPHFECGAFGHSATPPFLSRQCAPTRDCSAAIAFAIERDCSGKPRFTREPEEKPWAFTSVTGRSSWAILRS